MQSYTDKVVKIAEVKYGLEEHVVMGYLKYIEFGFKNGWPPRRTVDYIAHLIF